MLKNYFIVAFRSFFRHKLYSAINVFGLAIGLAACILLFLFVRHELSYDEFHLNKNVIFRVVKTVNSPYEGTKTEAVLPAPLGPALKEEFPEIGRAVRLSYAALVVNRAQDAFDERVIFADSDFFEMFSFPLAQGSPETSLDDPNSVVVSQEIAEKYFPDQEAIGQELSIKFGGRFFDFTVSGVVENIPDRSSIQFSIALPYDAILKQRSEEFVANWGNSFNSVFIQLQKGAHVQALQQKLPAFTLAHFSEIINFFQQLGFKADPKDAIKLWLQPLTTIRLDTRVQNAYEPIINPILTYILAGIALLILFIACINFINLAIARASTRVREIGVRKVVGAMRLQLIQQFWGEAILLSLVALLVGAGFAELFLPKFNLLTGKNLTIDILTDPANFLVLLATTALTGLLAGGYPAIILSRIRPVQILHGKLKLMGKDRFSKSLIVFQFFLSVVLIICAISLSRQVNYLRNKNLGFETARVVVVSGQGEASSLSLYREALRRHSNILHVSLSSSAISGNASRTLARLQGTNFQTYMIKADYDFLETLGLPLVAGRNFTRDRASDVTEAVIINETFANKVGWTHPLGKQFRFFGGQPATVIGVVKDFHFTSLHHSLGPLVIHMRPERAYRYVLARLQPHDLPNTIDFIRKQWRIIAPDLPFSYAFLDERLDRQYKLEESISRIAGYSTLFAILIACLGLFGLSALTTARRIKEIGIRKVVGATAPRIAALVSGQFLILVTIANIMAWPLAYIIVRQLLQYYAYRININIGYFVLAGFLSIGISLITVSYQAIKAALANPIEALRYE